jgi:two-component system, NtrC family, sensor histidine kinase PilS
MDWHNQLLGQLLVDVLLIGLIIISLGGNSGTYVMLYMMPVAASASLLGWTEAMFIWSVSLLSVLADGMRRWLFLTESVNWVLLGSMGVAGFATVALLRLAAERTLRLEKIARYAQTKALMTQELSEQHIKEDSIAWLVLDDRGAIQMMNAPVRSLAWQTGQVLEINQTIVATNPLHAWLCAVNQTTEQTIEWPPFESNSQAHNGPAKDQLHIKSSLLPHLKGYSALSMELASSRTARLRDQHLTTMGRLSASIAHEIRNPLAAISQAAELLQESANLHASDAAMLKMLLTNSARIDRIVHNLLGWSRGMQANRTAFNPYAKISQMVQEVCASLLITKHRLTVRLAPEPLPDVLFDEDHLYQIISNLIINATRYAQHNASSICIELRPRGRFVSLLVIDDGAAVDASIAEHLFEPFQSNAKEGTGLGLFLCREYARANQGSLQLITSDPINGGSLSWVHPPYTKAFVLNMPLFEH